MEIWALRHQITVLERQLGTNRPRFFPAYRMFLAALLHRLPRDVLSRFRLLVQPDTIGPAPERTSTTWASFLRSQADALLACESNRLVSRSSSAGGVDGDAEHPVPVC